MIERTATLGGILAAGLFWTSADIGLGLGTANCHGVMLVFTDSSGF